MRCLVFVKFLPGGSLSPEEFFARIKSEWNCVEDGPGNRPGEDNRERKAHTQKARSAICIAEYDSIQQLAIDLAIMPGAGISNVEVLPVSDKWSLCLRDYQSGSKWSK